MSDDADNEPMPEFYSDEAMEAFASMGNEDEGDCPSCGARLRYRDVIPEADVGCNYCPECGWEGGVG